MIVVVTTAWASPGSWGALHQGTEPVAAGTVWAGAGSGFAWSVDGEWFGATPGLEVGFAATDTIAVSLQGGTPIDTNDDTTFTTTPVALGGRWTFLETDHTRLAATWHSVVVPYTDPYRNEPFGFDDSFVWTGHSPGIALDTGGERVRFDLSVPLPFLTSYDQYVGFAHFPLPLGATGGLDVLLGEHHRLRFGLPELFQWSWRDERVYLDVGGIPLGVVGAVWVKVGAVLGPVVKREPGTPDPTR